MNDTATPGLPNSLSSVLANALVHDRGELGGIVLRILGIYPPASDMVVIAFTSHGSKRIDEEVGCGSDLPRFAEGDTFLQAFYSERASIETNTLEFVLLNEVTNTIPTPISTTRRPLERNMTTTFNDLPSNLNERSPDLTKLTIVFAEFSFHSGELLVDVLPRAPPGTRHRCPEEAILAFDCLHGFGMAFRGGDIIVNGEACDVAAYVVARWLA